MIASNNVSLWVLKVLLHPYTSKCDQWLLSPCNSLSYIKIIYDMNCIKLAPNLISSQHFCSSKPADEKTDLEICRNVLAPISTNTCQRAEHYFPFVAFECQVKMYNYQINAINLFLEVLKNSSYLWMLQLQAIRKLREQRTLFRNDFPETTTEKPASKVSLCSCEWDHRNVIRSMMCSSVENMRNIRLSVKGSERKVIQTPKYKTQEQHTSIGRLWHNRYLKQSFVKQTQLGKKVLCSFQSPWQPSPETLITTTAKL